MSLETDLIINLVYFKVKDYIYIYDFELLNLLQSGQAAQAADKDHVIVSPTLIYILIDLLFYYYHFCCCCCYKQNLGTVS